MTTHPLFVRRIQAYLWDCARYLGLAASTVPVGLVINRLGRGGDRRVALLVSALPPVAATVTASLQEAGPSGATAGKKREGLEVTTTAGRPPTLPQALVRNAVKILIPWQLGHVVAIGSSFGGFRQRDPLTWAAALITYPLLGVMVVAVARGNGLALHDRVAGTRVQGTSVDAPD